MAVGYWACSPDIPFQLPVGNHPQPAYVSLHQGFPGYLQHSEVTRRVGIGQLTLDLRPSDCDRSSPSSPQPSCSITAMLPMDVCRCVRPIETASTHRQFQNVFQVSSSECSTCIYQLETTDALMMLRGW